MSIDVIIICITILLSFIILSYISLKITSLIFNNSLTTKEEIKEEIKEDLILSEKKDKCEKVFSVSREADGWYLVTNFIKDDKLIEKQKTGLI